jgi:OOP family OmpA-OmpF porin
MTPQRSAQRAAGKLGIAVVLAPLALLLSPSRAEAQSTTFYLDRLQVAGAPDDGISVWRPQIGETRAFGQVAAGYSRNPLRIENHLNNADDNYKKALHGPPVADQLTTYFTVGAEILGRAAVSATFPLITYQRGYETDNAAIGLQDAVSIAPAAPSDLRIDGRALLAASDGGALKIGARVAFFFPTGDERSFAGDTGAWSNIGISTELDLFESLFATLNLGASIRPRAQLNDLTVGSELTYGLGVYAPLLPDRLRIGAEIFGSMGILPETLGEIDAAPLEGSLNLRLFVGPKRAAFIGLGYGVRLTGGYAPDARLVAAFGGAFAFDGEAPAEPGPSPRQSEDVDTDGDGIPDIVDMCPAEREDLVNPEDGCPEPPDSDKDGIRDPSDKCPSEPEDKDGINDADGCPEDDADGDGLPDAADKCPKEPGVRGEDPAKEGCPQFIRRVKTEVQLVKQIDFEFDRATILKRSYPILDEIAELLRVNPEIRLVSIEGHTDNRGSAEYNERLSHLRASAVRDYLVARGVTPSRLIFKGFGPRIPITTNDTPEGRAKNRRVEFRIVKQSAEAP